MHTSFNEMNPWHMAQVSPFVGFIWNVITRETDVSFNKLHYEGTVYFKHKYI